MYAFYVPVNEVLFWSRHAHQPPARTFILIYLALSLTGSIGTALYLAYHRVSASLDESWANIDSLVWFRQIK